ncbi:Hypothetical protein GLP15_3493 [Giardia lamblia P15]|uniref:EF-hand domain-containing protein n=1 Tax=Giardia intestinalis (strain P15) TaxID=658858 RepID=E1F0G2_GIAIA|nr:Hypothetical protein GLP15_3493 [Giardia lamblia P15]
MEQNQKLCVQTFHIIDKDGDNRISKDDLEAFLCALYDEGTVAEINIKAIIESLISTREPALDYVELLDFVRENGLLHGHQSKTQMTRAIQRLQGTRFSFSTADLESKMLSVGFEITQQEIDDVLEAFTEVKDGDVTGDMLAHLFSQLCASDLA